MRQLLLGVFFVVGIACGGASSNPDASSTGMDSGALDAGMTIDAGAVDGGGIACGTGSCQPTEVCCGCTPAEESCLPAGTACEPCGPACPATPPDREVCVSVGQTCPSGAGCCECTLLPSCGAEPRWVCLVPTDDARCGAAPPDVDTECPESGLQCVYCTATGQEFRVCAPSGRWAAGGPLGCR